MQIYRRIYTRCDEFFYNTSTYGFQAVLTTYIEEIRIMRDLQKYYLENAAIYGFLYNESLIGTKLHRKRNYSPTKDGRQEIPVYSEYAQAIYTE